MKTLTFSLPDKAGSEKGQEHLNEMNTNPVAVRQKRTLSILKS